MYRDAPFLFSDFMLSPAFSFNRLPLDLYSVLYSYYNDLTLINIIVSSHCVYLKWELSSIRGYDGFSSCSSNS